MYYHVAKNIFSGVKTLSQSSLLLGILVICDTAALALAVAEAPAVGSVAPEFTPTTNEGNQASLKDFHGKWVVLYFYPKDFTGGCTMEAHNFQIRWRCVPMNTEL